MIPTDIAVSAARYDSAPAGLPDRCFVLSNSERKLLACPRRYLLSVIEGLKQKEAGRARSYGQLYHKAKEAIYGAWMQDRAPTDAEVAAGLATVRAELKKLVSDGSMDPSMALELSDTIESNIAAWLHITGGGQPPMSYRLVAAEKALAMPIIGPSGRVFAPEMFLVRDGDRWRIARAGDKGAERVRWPWYFVGRLDMLFAHRHYGALYVSDDKTTGSPDTLIQKLTSDPQVPSYLALVRHNVRNGLLPGIPTDARVQGFWHRVTSSAKLTPPKVLKDGTLSRDARLRTPSWTYRAKLAELGLNPADYADHLAALSADVDAKIERHEHMDYSDAELDRFERELYGDAQRAASLWRAAYRARTLASLDVSHPRVPVCQLPGGSCDVVGPCMRDGELVRRSFVVQPWATWGPRSQSLSPGPAATPPAGESPDTMGVDF